jgi:hypothetical protein
VPSSAEGPPNIHKNRNKSKDKFAFLQIANDEKGVPRRYSFFPEEREKPFGEPRFRFHKTLECHRAGDFVKNYSGMRWEVWNNTKPSWEGTGGPWSGPDSYGHILEELPTSRDELRVYKGLSLFVIFGDRAKRCIPFSRDSDIDPFLCHASHFFDVDRLCVRYGKMGVLRIRAYALAAIRALERSEEHLVL